MAPPRESRDPRDGDPRGWDPDDDGAGTWGRPPTGGWGAVDPYGESPDARRGGEGYGRDRYGEGYAREGSGHYGSDSQAGWGLPGNEPPWQPEPPPSRPPGRVAGYPGTPRRAARRRRQPPWIALGVAVAAVVAILVLGFVAPGWFVTRVFDAAAVQTGVARILTDDYGVEGVADVRCPEEIEVVAGATFACDATIDGDPVTVPVRVTDGDGGYEVGRPT